MRRMRASLSFLGLLALLLGLLPAALGTPAAAEAELAKPVVVRLYARDKAHLELVSGSLDIWESHPDQGCVVARVSPEQYRWLEDLGYRLEVDPLKTRDMGINGPLDPRFYYFDSFYANPNGLHMVDFMQDVNAAYPELTELYDIGDAWLAGQPGEHDRDIWVLRITNEDPAYGPIEDKPAFFLFGGIHAREVAIPEMVIRYIQYLTGGYKGEGGYGLDADATWLVNHNVLYALVSQNPDGHWVDEQEINSYRRKNLDSDDGCSDPSSWGVDLNRNHSFLWGCCGGSSGDPCSETYRGPSRGSEPETQAFQNYFATVMEDQNGPNDDETIVAAPITTTGIFISLHSYSNLVLWPWGFDDYGDPPNMAGLTVIGRKFAYFTDYDPSGTIWYDVDGATDDWTYGKFGIPSYTFEIGPQSGSCGGFFPDYECLEGEDGASENFWAETQPAFLYAHKIARTPYLTGYGPDSEDVLASPGAVAPGELLLLTAEVADHRYPGDALQPIYGAEYFIDGPGPDGAGTPMAPVDGSWGGMSEAVEATVDTNGLSQGRHYLLVHGQNDDGDWGPFTAVFFYVIDPAAAPVIEGHVRDATNGYPLQAVVTAGVFQALTDPASGYYSLTVLSGTYDMSAVAADYVVSNVNGMQVQDYQVVQQDFDLQPLPPKPCVLLVDDDDNNPNVRGYWTTALDSLGYSYDVFDIGGGAGNGPDLDELLGYKMILWFSGDQYGGAEDEAGPNAADEAALAAYLDGGGRLFLSSQDYYYDRGPNAFMQDYLGVASVVNDEKQTSVTGAGAVYGGYGPYALVYPFNNYSDMVNPDGTAELAFDGDQGDAAVNKDGGSYRTTFWGFPWEALPSAAEREAILEVTADWFGGCACVPVSGADLSWSPIMPTVGQTVSFTGTAAGDTPLFFYWNFGDGDLGAGPHPSHTYLNPGLYTVAMTASNACGQEVVLHPLTVSPIECDAVEILAVYTEMVGCVVTFSAELSGTAPFSYDWDFGTHGGSSAEAPTIDFGASGSYPYTLTVGNPCGVDSAAGWVTVQCQPCEPVAGAGLEWVPAEPLVEEVVTFTGTVISGTPPISYAWALGDGDGDAGPVVQHAYAAAGAYTVTMTATNACGEEAVSQAIVVQAPCASVDILGLAYEKDECTFSYTAELDGDAPFDYVWHFGDGVTSTQIAPVHVYEAPGGTFTVTLEVSNCGGLGQDSDEIVVAAECTPDRFYLYLPLVLTGFGL